MAPDPPGLARHTERIRRIVVPCRPRSPVTPDTASLRNLRRCGFRDAIAWRVYRWDLSS